MKKKYNFSGATKRTSRVKRQISEDTVKVPTSIRLDGSLLAWYKTEAERLGIPYQTLIGSILHRYAQSELIDREEVYRIKNSG
ncbi:MAG: BrnA antitoxin family protein [Bdellovibrionaceae bacterium]|nr:BrnA antitoxin family protein [Pseudobdellovibrionaceae bacterium]